MGFRAVDRILPWKLPPSAKAVLVLLAFHENDKTSRCDPSVNRLTDESGLDRTTVMRALDELEKLAAIEIEKRSGMRSSYVIRKDWTGRTMPPVAPYDRSHHATEPVAPCDATGRTTPPDQEGSGRNRKAVTSLAEVPAHDELCGPLFPVKGAGTWRCPRRLAERLASDHPNIDTAAELERAATWCEANPAKRKTTGGMPRFVNGWLRRGADAVRVKPPSIIDDIPELSAECLAAAREVAASLPKDEHGNPLPAYADHQEAP